MLTSLLVRNYQSLKDVRLDLGGFTVVVGATGSGKSAVVRSIRALAENVTSPRDVSKGAKAFLVRADSDEAFSVLLERGKGQSTYRVLEEGTEQVYAKSGTDVPTDVRRHLGITEAALEPAQALQFAGQFDRPFLLSEPASKVAKVLGDLTDLDILFEAIREANRRRLEAQQKLKTRTADLDSLVERAQQFAGLKQDREKVVRAQESVRVAGDLALKVHSLKGHLSQLDVAETALQGIVVGDVPDLDGVQEKGARLAEARSLLLDLQNSKNQVVEWDQRESEAAAEIQSLEAEHHEKLVAAGTCPLCGREM